MKITNELLRRDQSDGLKTFAEMLLTRQILREVHNKPEMKARVRVGQNWDSK